MGNLSIFLFLWRQVGCELVLCLSLWSAGIAGSTTVPGFVTETQIPSCSFCRISCSSGWSQACYGAEDDPNLLTLFFSTSPSAELQACACHHSLLMQYWGGTTFPALHTCFRVLLIVGHKMALLASLLFWVFQRCHSKWQSKSSMRMSRWSQLSSHLRNRSACPLKIKLTLQGLKTSINKYSVTNLQSSKHRCIRGWEQG